MGVLAVAVVERGKDFEMPTTILLVLLEDAIKGKDRAP